MAGKKCPEVPFVLLCEEIDRPQAMASLSAGVTDFVFKQHIGKLAPVVRRVTREARARLELTQAQARVTAQAELLDLATDSIILTDAHGAVTYWNRGSERIYGWTSDEAIGQKVHALLQTQSPRTLEHLEQDLLEHGHWEGELKQRTRDGTPLVVISHWTLKGGSADAARLQINTNITERKIWEEALRRSEERYRRFVDEDLTGNLIMRPDGSIVACNPAFVRAFGFASIEEALSANFNSLLRNRKDGAELFARVRDEGAVERDELEMRQPHGEPVYVAARLVGSFDPQGQLTELQGYLFNDTKRKRLEHQLIQAQKMEGLGTLAGGIAHDFNNILTIILGYASQLDSRNPRPEQIPVAVKVIKEAVERGATLVQQLLTSARQAEARLSAVDLNALLREVERMLQATFPKMINFKLDLDPNFPLVTADRSQIHQVLLNLCVNARDAMPNGGTIFLQTSLVAGEQIAQYFTGAEAERYACLRVQDNGSGMTPEIKAHIFEPFYTTKERAKGTGLGLSVVYGVVNNHNGFVQVESEPDVGTTFHVYLPLGQTSSEAKDGLVSNQPLKTGQPQTILLVEDEDMLRELGIEILSGEGYRVLAARDGVEAVELFATHRDDIGLVVCDLGLPRLGGREAFLKMKEIKSSVRAIVASGYLEPSLRSEILKAGVIDTIQKPYDFRELLERIRSIIGNAQTEDDHPQLF
jgi:PAS domain S-box-containing protein